MTAILVVEDEKSLSDPLSYLLRREGYDVAVVDNGPAAIQAAAQTNPDLILLDLMLPGLPGTEVAKEIRTRSQVPIIMLTAKDTEVDIVVGLELGADDYVTKPYSSRELLARIRAVLRRRDTTQDASDGVIEYHGIVLDTDRHQLTVRGTALSLPLKEFELLELLMMNAGRVLTRGQIIDRVWGSDYFGDTKTLDVHIKRLRSKIEPTPSEPTIIVTVRGLGYRFDV